MIQSRTTCLILVALLSLMLVNISYTQQVEFGRSLHFDGDYEHINLDIPLCCSPMDPNWGEVYDDFTFEIWLKLQVNSGEEGIIFKFHDKKFYHKNLPNGKIQLVYFAGGSYTNEIKCEIEPNTWTHITLKQKQINNTTERLEYILNGIPESSISKTIYFNLFHPLGGIPLRIGHNVSTANERSLKGNVKEVRIWNIDREISDIQKWMNHELSGQEEGLAVYYKMNQGVAGGINSGENYILNYGNIASNNAVLQNFSLNGQESNFVSDQPDGFGCSVASGKNCAEFDGGIDRIRINHNSDFDFDKAFTIEYWMKLNALPQGEVYPIIKGNNNGTRHSFFTSLSHNGSEPEKCHLKFGQDSPGSQQYTLAANVIELKKWHHIAQVGFIDVHNKLVLHSYVDGQIVSGNAFQSIPMIQTDGPIRLGIFNGKMSNIRIWNKALKEEEIADNMNTFYPMSTEGLIARYRDFSDITEGLIDSQNNHIGLVVGTPYFSSDQCFVLFENYQESVEVSKVDGTESVSFTYDVRFCQDGFGYEWLLDGGTTSVFSNTINIDNITVDDLGTYQLKVTTPCGPDFFSKSINLSTPGQGERLHFDGENDYVKWHTNIKDENSYSIECWVKFDSKPEDQNVIFLSEDNFDNESNYSHVLRINENRRLEHMCKIDDGIEVIEYPQAIFANRWYYIAGVVNSSKIKIKVDNGVWEERDISNIGASGLDKFYLGKAGFGKGSFHGSIDELRIWKIEESDQTKGSVNSNDPNLLHYFRFNQGIAGSDNSINGENEIELDDLKTGSSWPLENFELTGQTSNWLGCDPFPWPGNSVSIPASKEVFFGNTLELNASSSIVSGSYQWYKEGGLLHNEGDKDYIKGNVGVEDGGDYFVIVEEENTCPIQSNISSVSIKGTGEVLNFDGIDDYVKVNSNAIGNEYTIEVWVKSSSDSTLKNIITSTWDTGPNVYYNTQIFTNESGEICHYYNDSNGHNYQNSGVKLLNNVWTHIAVSYKIDNEARIYINENLEHNESCGSSFQSGRYFYIGAQVSTYDGTNKIRLRPFEGEIDELKIWSLAKDLIDKEQIINTYDPNLKHYLRFNQGIANGNNTNPQVDIIIDNEFGNGVKTDHISMHNFSLQGDISNWTRCSPIDITELNITINDPSPVPGQQVIFNTEILGDTLGSTWQWQKGGEDIQGAHSPDFVIDNFLDQDAGPYRLQLTEGCASANPNIYPSGNGITISKFCFEDDILNPNTNDSNFEFKDKDTSLDNNKITTGYCNNDSIRYSGNDNIYKIDLTAKRMYVRMAISNSTAPFEMFLYDDCNIDNCVASTMDDDSNEPTLELLLDIGVYYLVIDSKFEGGNTYTLNVDFFDSKCDKAEPQTIVCDQVIYSDMITPSNLIDHYCNTPTDYSGDEYIFKVSFQTDTTSNIVVSEMKNADYDIFILNSICDEYACLASATSNSNVESISYGFEQDSIYYVVVDAKNKGIGSFKLSMSCIPEFTASDGDNDAYVDCQWTFDKKKCIINPNNGLNVRLIDEDENILYEENYNTATQVPDLISGSYQDYIGPDAGKDYVLRIKDIQTGQTTPCSVIDTGYTKVFQAPKWIIPSVGEFPDSIFLDWQNNSELSDQFRIFRDDVLIATMTDDYHDGDILQFIDAHQIDDLESIHQGSTYNYKVKTYNDQFNTIYSTLDTTAHTFNINFNAQHTPTEITLAWNDVSEYATSLRIERDDEHLITLEALETSYTDKFPIHGANVTYSLKLLRESVELIEVDLETDLPPNGQFSGKVVTERDSLNGNYPLNNVTLKLFKDDILISSETTNVHGEFEFEDIYYGIMSDFKITAEKADIAFTPDTIITNLNQANPEADNIFFYGDKKFDAESKILVESFNGDAEELTNSVDMDWVYISDPSEVYYNIYRNGELITSGNNSNGIVTSYEDTKGIPGMNYNYNLHVFKFVGETVESQTLSINVDYPQIMVLGTFSLENGDQSQTNPLVKSFDPRVYLDWSSNSYNNTYSNYDGFRIRRNKLIVADLDAVTIQFDHLPKPGTYGDYELTVYRNVDGQVFESEPISDWIISNQLWDPGDVSIEGRKINILDVNANHHTKEFYGDALYDGILVKRKNGWDDEVVEIGRVTKDEIVSFVEKSPGITMVLWDQTAIPDSTAEYSVSTYIEVDDQLFKRCVHLSSNTIPSVAPPSEAMPDATEATGKVILHWIDNSVAQYQGIDIGFKYTGYEITRELKDEQGFPRIGEVSLGHFLAPEMSYSDLINNPVFDLFDDALKRRLYTYRIKSYLEIDGIKYYSTPLIIDGKGPLNDTDVEGEPIPSNFVASKNIPDHIHLSWDWTAVKKSDFKIFRNNTIIATLDYTARDYYDYEAPIEPGVEYEIMSVYNNDQSAPVKAIGQRASVQVLEGRIYNNDTKKGIPNVLVIYENLAINDFSAKSFTGSIKTDETGYYRFRGLPQVEGMMIKVMASSQIVDFDDSNQISQEDSDIYSINLSKRIDTIDFVDYMNYDPISTLSEIQSISAYPNPVNMNVQLVWSPTAGEFDGFELYRENVMLADISANDNEFDYIDSFGTQGIIYVYKVRAYMDEGNDIRTYSEMTATLSTYPSLSPIENLTMTPILKKNSMMLSWSHPTDSIDQYHIYRNNNPMDTIDQGDRKEWIDSTGIPGVKYRYEVIGVKEQYSTIPVEIVERFIGVSEVQEFTSDTTSVNICDGEKTSENHVSLSWKYEPGLAQGFELYRNNELIARIDSIVLEFGNEPFAIGDTMLFPKVGEQGFRDGEFYYKDYEGMPGTNYIYHILANVEREGEVYSSGIESNPDFDTITFPALAEVSGFNLDAHPEEGTVQLNFTYDTLGITGFEIIREINGTENIIDTLVDHRKGEFEYLDESGLPGTDYTYKIRSYLSEGGNEYFSASSCPEEITYPELPIPQDLVVSKGEFEDHITLDWSLDYEVAIDSIEIKRTHENSTSDYIVRTAPGQRSFIDIINEDTSIVYTYELKTIKKIDGTEHYSLESEANDGWIKWVNQDISHCDSNVAYGKNGFAVDIYGDWAVSGAPHGNKEYIIIFKRTDDQWAFHEKIESPFPGQNTDFGYAVSIYDTTIAVGARLINKVVVYHLKNDRWEYPDQILIPGPTNPVDPPIDKFGHSLDLHKNQLIVSAPTTHWYIKNEDHGDNWGDCSIYEKNIVFEFVKRITPPNVSSHVTYTGEGVSVYDSKAVFSYRNHTEGNNHYHKAEDPWSQPNGFLNALSGTYSKYDNTEIPISNYISLLNQEAFIIGGREGASYLSPTFNKKINKPFNSNNSIFFGYSVAIDSLIIDNSGTKNIYLIVGDPKYSNNSGSGDIIGSVHMFKYIDNDAPAVDEIVLHNSYYGENDNDVFGRSVSFSSDALIIGAPGYDNNHGKVYIYNLYPDPVPPPQNVIATDGTSHDGDTDEVTITWEFDAGSSGENFDAIQGFNIYRDGVKLVTRSKHTMEGPTNDIYAGQWIDTGGDPGRVYVYTVKAKGDNIELESDGLSDTGYSMPDGRIRGEVLTANSFVPVPGVNITARGIVRGEVYEYHGTTIGDGTYIIDEVYYDPDNDVVTKYYVTAEFGDHLIEHESNDTALLYKSSKEDIVDFIDKSSYVIQGYITRPGLDCDMDGIKVTPYINGQPDYIHQAISDKEGFYGVVVDPYDTDLNQLIIKIYRELIENGDTTRYRLTPQQDTSFTNFNDFPSVTILDYIEDYTYPINLKVQTPCGAPIQNARWDIRVRSEDGCYEEIFTTNSQGEVVADLYPMNYKMKVIDVDLSNPEIEQALDFFAGYPAHLPLLELHIDSFSTLSKNEISDLAGRKFTFHKAADIEVNGFGTYMCNPVDPPAVIEQGETYFLDIEVSEEHNGIPCLVNEGTLRISNPASSGESTIEIIYDKDQNEFPTYEFIAGDPNSINPHIHVITIDYLSGENVFISRKYVNVFVEGTVTIPGSGIIVNPVKDEDEDFVPFPLMVLRDPPGDGSQSYISSGQSFERTTKVSKTIGGSGSVHGVKGVSLAGVGFNVEASTELGGSDKYNNTTTHSVTLNQSIYTSNDDKFIGPDADVLVGVGLVATYGITHDYELASCDSITITRNNGISPIGLNTTWNYTVGQIKEKIIGYRNDSILIENGSLILTEGTKELSLDSARAKNNTYIQNWEAMLQYNQLNTLPHYDICASDPIGINDLKKQAIYEWQDNLCPLIGTMEGDDFVLDDSIIWTNGLFDMYNAAWLGIRNITIEDNALWSFPINGALSPWVYPDDEDITSFLNKPEVTAYVNANGWPIQNITMGGGVQQDISVTNVNNFSDSHTSTFFNNSQLSFVKGFDAEFTIITPLTGVKVNYVKSKAEFGVTGKFDFTHERSSTTTTSSSIQTGYTLYDDDALDDYSVIVIQPLAPNHTPYFEYYGGHTSCPPEEGSIFIDNPEMGIVTAGGTVSDYTHPVEIPANGSLSKMLRVVNNTTIASQPVRTFKISLDQASNNHGAIITLGGTNLNNGDKVVDVAPNTNLDMELLISRSPGSEHYQYHDINFIIEPDCEGGPTDMVTVSVNFECPCSEVNISDPDFEWIIDNGANAVLHVRMDGYDSENEVLDEAVFQYRRNKTGFKWKDAASNQFVNGNPVSVDLLKINDDNIVGADKFFWWNWQIPSETNTTTGESFPDGEYQVRIKMDCGASVYFSDIINGRIVRDAFQVIDQEPHDQQWDYGDDISFTFNKTIDCGEFNVVKDNTDVVSVYNIDSDTMLDDFEVSCSQNELYFSSENMHLYAGDSLEIILRDIPSEVGSYSEDYSYRFNVLTSPPVWTEEVDSVVSGVSFYGNWQFSDELSISSDTNDIISVWVDNEVRGSGNIQYDESNQNYHTDFTITGSQGEILEFRIWVDSHDQEYLVDNNNMTYPQNGSIGSADTPHILSVNQDEGLVRYIPLRQGWTGFSINLDLEDNNINAVLSNLSNVSNDDKIVSATGMALYDSIESKWVNTGANILNSILPGEGYRIYLQNPDTLRIVGDIITNPSNKNLVPGWNWFGYPFNEADGLNDKINIDGSSNGFPPFDQIVSDYPVPGFGSVFAYFIYDYWSGSMTSVHPFGLYKIFIADDDGDVLSWDGNDICDLNTPVIQKSLATDVVNPYDHNTWKQPSFNSRNVMPVIAKIYLNNIHQKKTVNKVAFFHLDTIKGYGKIVKDIYPPNKGYHISILCEDLASGIPYDIRYYDKTNDKYYVSDETLFFNIDGYGNYTTHSIINFSNEVTCVNTLNLNSSDSPLYGLYSAKDEIIIQGPVLIPNGSVVKLKAPNVTLDPDVEVEMGAILEITQTGCGND